MNEQSHQYNFREYPARSAIFGLGLLLVGLYIYWKNAQRIPLAVFLGVALLIILFSSILTVQADRLTAVLSISRRGLLRHYQRKINFHEIESVQLGRSYSSNNGNSTAYRIEIRLNDGDVVPLRTGYSSGHRKKAETVEALREFIGVGGAPTSERSRADFVSQIMQSHTEVEQEVVEPSQVEGNRSLPP